MMTSFILLRTLQGEVWDGDEDGNDEEKRVAQLLNDHEIPNEYKVAFRQQTIIGWEYIFTGKFARGWRKCWTEQQQWATKFAILMMKWGYSDILIVYINHPASAI